MTVPPGDDPEQRISDLERSLSGAAATGEQARHGLRVGWLVLSLMVAALLIGGAAILTARTTRTVTGAPTAGSEVTPTQRPVLPSAPPTPVPPIPAPTVRPVPTPTPRPTAAPPGGDLSVAGVDTRRTIACSDSVVSVSGVNNSVAISGHCRRVDVSGMENVVTVDQSDAIVVSGLNNTVTYRLGDPRLDESGFGNSVARG